MKQNRSLSFFFSLVFVVGTFFFSSTKQSFGTTLGEDCTGGVKSSDCAAGLICVANKNGNGYKSCQVPGSSEDTSRRNSSGTTAEDTVTGTTCTGNNGYRGTCILADGECSGSRTKSWSSDCGTDFEFTCCTNEPASSGFDPSAGNRPTGLATPGGGSASGGTSSGSECASGYTCLSSCSGSSSGTCDGGFGVCCRGGTSGGSPSSGGSTPTSGACYDAFGATVPCTYDPTTGRPLGGGGTTSPTPSTNGGTPSGGNGATGSNRPPASGPSGSAPSGLHIPTSAETGLSSVSVTSLIQNLMKWLLYIVGFVAIIAFVISGIQYLLAGASEEMAKQAKANMQYAIIGVVVALSALIIIRAIQSVLSGAWIF